jgi:hypothetical protein
MGVHTPEVAAPVPPFCRRAHWKTPTTGLKSWGFGIDRTVGEIPQQPASRRGPADAAPEPKWFAKDTTTSIVVREAQPGFGADSDRSGCGSHSAQCVGSFTARKVWSN